MFPDCQGTLPPAPACGTARAAGIPALQTAGCLACLSGQGCSRTSPREAGGQEVSPFSRALFRVETRLVSFDPLPGAPASHPESARHTQVRGYSRSSPDGGLVLPGAGPWARGRAFPLLGGCTGLSPCDSFSLYFLLNFSSTFFFGLGKTHSLLKYYTSLSQVQLKVA